MGLASADASCNLKLPLTLDSSDLTTLGKLHLWHPFTPMQDWLAPEHEPLVLAEGRGCYLYDQYGKAYLDGNASIWTNIHGHAHPKINAAIKAQLDRVAHTSFLGFTNPPAIELATKLVQLWPANTLTKVFYSDNGSTAIEAAVRMALQYWSQNGKPERDLIFSFDQAYHGDTLGAASLGGISLFKGSANHYGYAVQRVPNLAALEALDHETVRRMAAIIIEPLMQGAAGMRVWPKGMLKQLRVWCDERDIFLILDEVMTGFGRTGKMFACQQEDVVPDLIAFAKGLTGGYLPLAVTMATQRIFDGFLGAASEGRTLYYGHSYTGNQLGCAAALASLEVFREEAVLEKLQPKIAHFTELLNALTELPNVGEVRQCGLMAGVEIVAQKQPRIDYPAAATMGAKVCVTARKYGVLTRPIVNTIVLMAPLAITEEQLRTMIEALRKAITEVCG